MTGGSTATTWGASGRCCVWGIGATAPPGASAAAARRGTSGLSVPKALRQRPRAPKERHQPGRQRKLRRPHSRHRAAPRAASFRAGLVLLADPLGLRLGVHDLPAVPRHREQALLHPDDGRVVRRRAVGEAAGVADARARVARAARHLRLSQAAGAGPVEAIRLLVAAADGPGADAHADLLVDPIALGPCPRGRRPSQLPPPCPPPTSDEGGSRDLRSLAGCCSRKRNNTQGSRAASHSASVIAVPFLGPRPLCQPHYSLARAVRQGQTGRVGCDRQG